MRLNLVLGLLGLGSLATAYTPRDYSARDYYVLELDSSSSPSEVAAALGLNHDGQLGELQGHQVFSSAKKQDADVVHLALQERKQRRRSVGGSSILDGVKFAQKQKLKKRLEKRGPIPPPPVGYTRTIDTRQDEVPVPSALARQAFVAGALQISDPTFNEQWHLFNPVQLGHDVNVTDVWLQGITGFNATVAIVDDGLDMYSDDLKDNYFADGSWDFNDQKPEPRPGLSDDRHGTRCAGEVSAVKNNVCGIGVAYNSNIAGIRILSKQISDAEEAEALNYALQKNDIYSCSWGPPDDGRSMEAPGIIIKKAMLNAVQTGRRGLGSIYVFASGNGAANEDNCNFDGYTNSIYSITVGAIDRKGLHPYYSEHCSAQLVVTYSSGSGDSIHTTDVGTNACSSSHGGTSAAAPLAAGIFALVLQIRPDLTWRDMQYLAMQNAVPIDLDTGEWQTTTIGKKFSHTFGYGKVDSWAIVEAAKTYQNVKPQAWYYSPWMHVNQAIPQGNDGLAVSFEVTATMLKEANLARLEHVTVSMNIQHGRRGDLSVDLISPDKLVSHLATTRRLDASTEGYDDWTFMSVVHWGESGVGTWTVIVKDTIENEHNGTFIDWHLKLWGESIDADRTTLLPMPDGHDDDDHDKIITSTTTIAGSTQAITPLPTMTSLVTNPTDHPDRPVNAKPTNVDDTEDVATPTAALPEVTPEPTESPASSWLPSFFPTFGVSSKTQIWIYGAAALILIFCTAMGVYLFMARRKRLRNDPRGEWEFDLIEDDEVDGLNGGRRGGKLGKGGKRRAGELYDAFAAGSDDDSEGEYIDDDEAKEESEKRPYADDDKEGSGQHVIGDAEDEDEEDKVTPKDALIK